jgi:SAM-dependent methyltransferase
MKLLTSVYPSISFDISYENYAHFLTFTDKHEHEADALALALPDWVESSGRLKAIDIGAGSGRLATVLMRLFGQRGVDLSVTLLEPAGQAARAMREAHRDDPRVEVEERSVQDYLESRPSEVFDLVLASHVNYYFEDRSAFFAAMLSMVRPGGTLCCISGAISLLHHPFYRDLGPLVWRSPGVDRSFGLDGYGACAEELELIAFQEGYVFTTYRSPASLTCRADDVRRAIVALRSLETAMADSVCRCFGFLLRVPVEAIFRARQHVVGFCQDHQLDKTGLRIECEDKVLLLRR